MSTVSLRRRVTGALLAALSLSCTPADGDDELGLARAGLDEAISDPNAEVIPVRPGTRTVTPGPTLRWATVVNKNDVMPNSLTAEQPAGRLFNSFNQPSVNADALVVFRARSRGGPPLGSPTRGLYVRDMVNGDTPLAPISTVAGGSGLASKGATAVPAPNNLTYPPAYLPTGFIEFPSIPRIAIHSNAIASRGNHQPVWRYDVEDPDTGVVTETRAGTTGLYVNLDARNLAGSALLSAMTKLGAVPGFELHAVPGLPVARPFDVFPGAPAITDDGHVVFKGNFTFGVAETGVFYRPLLPGPVGGSAFTERLATSQTAIPNLASCATSSRSTFGSTAPPSAAMTPAGVNVAVFVGLDNEWAPSCGGLYLAPLEPDPPLTTLVALGSPVPDEPGAVFTQLGEGLSFDGRFVGFWAAWGTATQTLRLYCPLEGDKDRIDFCNHTGLFDPVSGERPGDPLSVCDDLTDASDRCYQERQVPVNQGIFLHDTSTGATARVADNVSGPYTDFLFWVYSGHVPGTDGGEDDGEVARWRSSAFNAVTSRGAFASVVFKARTAKLDPVSHVAVSPVDGLYLRRLPGSAPTLTLLDTTMPGTVLDPEAVDPLTGAALPIVSLGLERDGLRGRWLVVNASMGAESEEEESASMAGIYVARVP